MSFTKKAGLHVLTVGSIAVLCSICEVIFRTVVEDNEGALLALVVDGSAIGIRNADAIEHDGLFLRRVKLEETICGLACQHILDDCFGGVGCYDVVAIDGYNASIIAAHGSRTCLAESDGDGLGERGVLDVVVIASVYLQSLGDGTLIELYSKLGDIASGRRARCYIVACCFGRFVVVVACCRRVVVAVLSIIPLIPAFSGAGCAGTEHQHHTPETVHLLHILIV